MEKSNRDLRTQRFEMKHHLKKLELTKCLYVLYLKAVTVVTVYLCSPV